ncbi:unnamed protein product [Ilex paraguariensis]|uniref:Uncharacterized protein n=1 Tax=Ilex paraguariensis TaxID=185542 RepID=A0ABC8UAS0_9AQUA
MAGVEFLSLVMVVAMVYGVRVGGYQAIVMTLESAFPANKRIDLKVLRSWDKARHACILQGVVGGIVDFPAVGSTNPYIVRKIMGLIVIESDQKQDIVGFH